MTPHDRMRKRISIEDERKMIVQYTDKCKYKGSVQLAPKEVQAYIQAKDKTKYLKSIGKVFK